MLDDRGYPREPLPVEEFNRPTHERLADAAARWREVALDLSTDLRQGLEHMRDAQPGPAALRKLLACTERERSYGSFHMAMLQSMMTAVDYSYADESAVQRMHALARQLRLIPLLLAHLGWLQRFMIDRQLRSRCNKALQHAVDTRWYGFAQALAAAVAVGRCVGGSDLVTLLDELFPPHDTTLASWLVSVYWNYGTARDQLGLHEDVGRGADMLLTIMVELLSASEVYHPVPRRQLAAVTQHLPLEVVLTAAKWTPGAAATAAAPPPRAAAAARRPPASLAGLQRLVAGGAVLEACRLLGKAAAERRSHGHGSAGSAGGAAAVADEGGRQAPPPLPGGGGGDGDGGGSAAAAAAAAANGGGEEAEASWWSLAAQHQDLWLQRVRDAARHGHTCHHALRCLLAAWSYRHQRIPALQMLRRAPADGIWPPDLDSGGHDPLGGTAAPTAPPPAAAAPAGAPPPAAAAAPAAPAPAAPAAEPAAAAAAAAAAPAAEPAAAGAEPAASDAPPAAPAPATPTETVPASTACAAGEVPDHMDNRSILPHGTWWVPVERLDEALHPASSSSSSSSGGGGSNSSDGGSDGGGGGGGSSSGGGGGSSGGCTSGSAAALDSDAALVERLEDLAWCVGRLKDPKSGAMCLLLVALELQAAPAATHARVLNSPQGQELLGAVGKLADALISDCGIHLEFQNDDMGYTYYGLELEWGRPLTNMLTDTFDQILGIDTAPHRRGGAIELPSSMALLVGLLLLRPGQVRPRGEAPQPGDLLRGAAVAEAAHTGCCPNRDQPPYPRHPDAVYEALSSRLARDALEDRHGDFLRGGGEQLGLLKVEEMVVLMAAVPANSMALVTGLHATPTLFAALEHLLRLDMTCCDTPGSAAEQLGSIVCAALATGAGTWPRAAAAPGGSSSSGSSSSGSSSSSVVATGGGSCARGCLATAAACATFACSMAKVASLRLGRDQEAQDTRQEAQHRGALVALLQMLRWAGREALHAICRPDGDPSASSGGASSGGASSGGASSSSAHSAQVLPRPTADEQQALLVLLGAAQHAVCRSMLVVQDAPPRDPGSGLRLADALVALVQGLLAPASAAVAPLLLGSSSTSSTSSSSRAATDAGVRAPAAPSSAAMHAGSCMCVRSRLLDTWMAMQAGPDLDAWQVLESAELLQGLILDSGSSWQSRAPPLFNACCAYRRCLNLEGPSEASLVMGGWRVEGPSEVSLVVMGGWCVCGGCGVARYCSRDCQEEDWFWHKSACRAWANLRRAAAQ